MCRMCVERSPIKTHITMVTMTFPSAQFILQTSAKFKIHMLNWPRISNLVFNEVVVLIF